MNGFELWSGKSRIDGEPVVCIATGSDPSKNAKTGDMLQTWILRADMDPIEAMRSGDDESVCGDCVHRVVGGKGSCYVNVGTAPSRIWEAWSRGSYPKATAKTIRAIAGQKIRFGSYGDPAAVPIRVWRKILPENPKDSTGYTHQWRKRTFLNFSDFLMASVESEAEAEEAKALGWRPFLVVPLNRSIPDGFAHCPGDKLFAGTKLSCEECAACNGNRGASSSIAIYVHGRSATTFSTRKRKPNLPIVTGRAPPERAVIIPTETVERFKRVCRDHKIPMRQSVQRFMEAAARGEIDPRLI